MMSSSKSSENRGHYTKPEQRQKLKNKIQASNKGGRPGQWSARKAQLLTQEYERQGGGYKGQRTAAQKHLKKWGEEQWQTQSGQVRARHGRTTERYLPKKAWEDLTPAQKKATNRRKKKGSKHGKQFVSNTPAARKASLLARREKK